MDINTPLSSIPQSEHDMEPKNKNVSKKRAEAAHDEPSKQVINNILSYSKALKVSKSKNFPGSYEYIVN